MLLNKNYLLLATLLLPNLMIFSEVFAKQTTVAKLYTVTREGEAKAKVSFVATRASLDENFRAPRSQVVSDLQLINVVTKDAINKAREKALSKAYERCYRDFSNCQEVAMQVVEAEASKVKTDTDEVDSGLAMEVEKTAKAEAKVTIQVRGNSQQITRNEKRSTLPQELPSNIKESPEVIEGSEKSEEGNSLITGRELVSLANEQK